MEWLNYLLKVSACTVLFYSFYHFFLKRLTFFSFNRYYLLGTLILSMVIPLLQMEVNHLVPVEEIYVSKEDGSNTLKGNSLPNETVSSVPSGVPVKDVSVTSVYSWEDLVLYVYIGISTILLFVFTVRMLYLLKPLRLAGRRVGRLKVIYKPYGFTNCSFFNYVFIADEHLSESELDILLQHEGEHSRRYHSLDRLFIAVCRIVLWFNPLVYLYDRALELVHEYEADEETSVAVGEHSYAELLLKMAIQGRKSVMVHHFALVPVKERIKMLFIIPSTKIKRLIYLAVLPLLAGLCWSFCIVTVYKPDLSEARVIYKDPSEKTQDSNPPKQRDSVDVKAEKEREQWQNSETFKKQMSSFNSMKGKKLLGMVKHYYAGGKNDLQQGFLIEYDSETYLLDVGRNNIMLQEELGPGDIITFVAQSAMINRGGPVTLISSEIIKEGKRLYKAQDPVPMIFGFEKNGVSFIDGEITKVVKIIKDTRNLQILAQGYTFLVKINKDEVNLNMLNDFVVGDQLRLRYVLQKKTGSKSYLIHNWISMSKDVKQDGVQNKTLFDKFYVKRTTDQLAGTSGSALRISYAGDSTRIDQKSGLVISYGDVMMSSDKLKAKTDKIEYDLMTQISLATNVNIYSVGSGETARASYAKFDMKMGTYELLKTRGSY